MQAGSSPDKNAVKVQDLHSILDKLLESYVQLQNTGFTWDLAYNGKVYKDAEFVLYTPFFKVDTDEAEKLCARQGPH